MERWEKLGASRFLGRGQNRLGPAEHLTDGGANIITSLKEAFLIGLASNAAVVLSHREVTGKENIGWSRETLELTDHVREDQKADLIVINHHLFFADFLLKDFSTQ